MKKLLLIMVMLLCWPLYVQAETKPLTIMLDWQLNPDHAPLWVGKHYGFFAKQGIDITWIAPSDSTDQMRFAAIGKVDLALTYEPQWIIAEQQGLNLIWVATLVGQPLSALMVKADIKTMQQLKGKTIGYSGSTTDNLFLQSMLKHAGLTSDDIQTLNIHYAGVQSMAAGRVDGVAAVMRNVEPIELQDKGIAYHLFLPEQYGTPSYAEIIIVANPALKKDARIPGFVKALQQSIAFLKAHPESCWQAFAKDHPELADETTHKIWLATIPYFDSTPGYFDQAQYAATKAHLIQLGLLA